ncbi:hypothetical protein K2X89_02430, partial [Myxococcota bacterium]|nr:hypothetical protein [Myxococcota bacterium]
MTTPSRRCGSDSLQSGPSIMIQMFRRPAPLLAFPLPLALPFAIALLLATATALPKAAAAATRTMVGAVGVLNPDVAQPGLFDGKPGAFGKKFGPHPPTASVRLITAAGATLLTSPGRKLTLPANRMNFAGAHFRDFPAFPGIAQSTKTFMSIQPAATFMNGGGALAFCPGPGCNSAGAGTAISYCPALSPSPAGPGSAMAPVGNWNCTWYTAAGPGRRGVRLAISNDSGAAHFGGTLRLLRSQRATIWRVVEPPATPMAFATVERAWRTGVFDEAAGGPNFVEQALPEHNGPKIRARLNARGAITATAGCANGLGTVGPGKTYMGLPGPL